VIEYIVKFNGSPRAERKGEEDYGFRYFAEGVTCNDHPDLPSLFGREDHAARYPTPQAAFEAAMPYLGMGGGYVVLPVETPDPLPEPIEQTAWFDRRDGREICRSIDVPGATPYRVRIEFLERLS